MVDTLRPGDPPDFAKYNFAGMFIAIALDDLLAALEALPGIAKQVGDDLNAAIRSQGPATILHLRQSRGDVDSLPADRRDAIRAITDIQRHAEDRVLYSATVALTMASVHLESVINAFLIHNFGPKVGMTVERLAYEQKYALAWLLHKRDYPGHIGEAVGEIVDWRNEFAHGRPAPLPGGLKKRAEPRALNMPPTAREMMRDTQRLLRGFLVVARALIALNTSATFIGQPQTYDGIEAQLARCDAAIKHLPADRARPAPR